MDINKITADKIRDESSTLNTYVTQGSKYLIDELGDNLVRSILAKIIVPEVESDRNVKLNSFNITHWDIVSMINISGKESNVGIGIKVNYIHDVFWPTRNIKSFKSYRFISLSSFIASYRNYQMDKVLDL
jgi:hypothetical protein